jgi:hypothetical protein
MLLAMQASAVVCLDRERDLAAGLIIGFGAFNLKRAVQEFGGNGNSRYCGT